MSSSGEPTQDELRRLVDRLRPKITRLFERHGVSAADAESRMTAALARLSYRWDRVRDREGWLLTALEKGLVASPEESSKEPRDE
jgi:hypothetical protein